MRKHFPLYYHLTDEERRQLFKSKDCYFVFDTSALLDIYRLGRATVDKVFKLLEKFKHRIIIPRHVAREYHDNMLSIITEMCSEYGNFLGNNTAEAMIKRVIEVTNNKSIKCKLRKFIGPAIEEFLKDLRDEQEYMLSQFRTWKLQNKLSDALEGMLLDGFTKDELAKLEEEGVERYAKNVPPGYKDEAKGSNKYGDFIIWKETLIFAQKKSCSIIFVSGDLKEDWLQKLHGMTCGPRQELLEEFKQYSPNGDFHVYALDQFMRFANEGDNVLDENDISEVKEIVTIPVVEKSNMPVAKSMAPEKKRVPTDDKSEEGLTAKSVAKGQKVEKGQSSPACLKAFLWEQ